ncbi:MAG TPA: hypothetical protein VFK73_02475 [Paludibacter sp.]|nr:hypothetical protein [Paludibacter sp.]
MRKLLLLIAVIASCSLSVESQNLLAGWDGNGVTGATSKPNDVGWLNNVTASIPWTVANGSGGCRFRDSGVTGGYTAGSFTYEIGGAALTSRQLMFRWDADAYVTSFYAYPVTLEACSSYTFTMDFVCGGSATPPQNLTVGISTTPIGTGRLSSQTFTSASTNLLYRTANYTFITGATGGIYYMTFNGPRSWFGINNLLLKKNSNKLLDVTTSSLALTNVNKTASFTIAGNSLPNAVNITAPAGITLSKTTVSGADAQCGVQVTATYNYTQPLLTKDTIVVTTDTVGGTITKKIPFTYTKPTLSVFERSIEIENNGKSYPLTISSVNNTVDSVYVYGTNGFTVSKSGYAASDFVSNNLSVDVTSIAAPGESGKLIFKGPHNVLIDSIIVKKVAPYTRYYIRQNTSQLVFGSSSAGAFPVLTAQNGLSSQKFIFRKVNVNPASTIDTVYIVQDSLYRALRKSSANAWDTELGAPSVNSKWVVQSQGNNIVSLLNTVTGKVIGTDALTANSRMYTDKTWVAGNNTEWVLVDAGINTAVNRINSVNPTVIVDHRLLRVVNAESYTVYSVQGIKVMDVRKNTSDTRVVLNQGIYVVKTNNGVTKVIVE